MGSEKQIVPSESVTTTEFSRFIREASLEEKEKVYGEVIERAIARQTALLENPAAKRT